jgi:hypothetical protein
MPNIQAKDAAEATIYLYSTKANSDETPAVSQENLLDALEPQTNTTAPSTDTAAAGINGRLIRLAQRLTSLIALLPASLGQANMAGSLSVTVASNQSAVPVSGPLTDTQLRATSVPVSGTVTANAGSGTFAVSGPLTDTQLRATAVPVSGTVTANAGTGTFAVSGPLTDTQLRATAVPVSGPLTAAQLTTAALATNATAEAIRDRLPTAFLTPGLLAVDTLATPGTPRVQATSGTSADITLTTTCRRVSMYATQGTWYSLTGAATSSSHYIGPGERLDFDVPASTIIRVLQESTAGSIRITELT